MIDYLKRRLQMRFIPFLILFLLINGFPSKAQSLPDSTAREFINSLLVNRNNLDEFVLPEELSLSGRLGISYKGIDKKYLISNDIDSAARVKFIRNKFTFTYSIERLAKNYSYLKVEIPSLNLMREYFFKGHYLVSKPYYYSRNWEIINSKYFVFHISNKSQFNCYAIEKLDSFITRIAHLLKYNDERISRLKQNKINYFLCKDENEIKQLTGFNARGLYYIPYDYIITTYTCHYHELLHLLMNYKLNNLYLYTLPFLQEGFAVAFGGRGGKEPDVILDMGLFLVKSGFLDYNSLLSKQQFYQSDISMSYPVSGMYNKFLIDEAGIDKYLELYQKYSASEDNIEILTIDSAELPPYNRWQNYVNAYYDSSIIISQANTEEYKVVAEKSNKYKISSNDGYYLFQIKDTLLLQPEYPLKFKSKLFGEILPNRNYKWEKYAVIADSNEISVYNFYSNNLIAKYVRGFSIAQQPVKSENGLYRYPVITFTSGHV